eukprot:g73527.t1
MERALAPPGSTLFLGRHSQRGPRVELVKEVEVNTKFPFFAKLLLTTKAQLAKSPPLGSKSTQEKKNRMHSLASLAVGPVVGRVTQAPFCVMSTIQYRRSVREARLS